MKADLQLAANYRFTVADEETAARVLCGHIGAAETLANVHTCAMAIKRGGEKTRLALARAFRDYSGPLAGKLRVAEAHNKIPSVLRVELAKLIAGQTIIPTLKANYLALGTGSAAPADGDTALGAEVFRGAFTQRTAAAGVAYLDKFFTSSEVGGLHVLEAGTFVDGTGTAGSGYLLSRVLMDVTLAATETLSVNVSIAVTSAT